MRIFVGLWLLLSCVVQARAADRNITRIFLQQKKMQLVLSFNHRNGHLLEFGVYEGAPHAPVLRSFYYERDRVVIAWQGEGKQDGPVHSFAASVIPEVPGGLVSGFGPSFPRELRVTVPEQREQSFALRVDVTESDFEGWRWTQANSVGFEPTKSWDQILDSLARTDAPPSIKRWRMTLPGRNVGTYQLCLVSIYDAYGPEPVLLEFACHEFDRFHGGITANLDMTNVHRFEVTDANAHPKFAILIDNGTTLSLLGGKMISLGRFHTSEALVDVTSTEDFAFIAQVPNPKLLFEPNTANPIPYAQYFAPKHIFLGVIDHSDTWAITNWPSSTQNLVLESKDLAVERRARELRGRFVNRLDEVLEWIARDSKPSVAEFLAFVGGPPKPGEENPFAEFHPNLKDLERSLLNYIPRLIAGFGAAFPDAIFYGLGRDIFLTSDALDAYYRHHGQPDRVVRVGASAGSFDVNNVEQVTAFLATLGIDPFARSPNPRIFFDITSYGGRGRMSQSVQLMRAAYRPWVRAGHRPDDLLRQINFVSTGYEGSTLHEVTRAEDIATYFRSVTANENGPDRILKFPNSPTLQYTDAWHGPFQSFVRDSSGRVSAPPGGANLRTTKLKLLAELWAIVDTVARLEFWRARKDVAKRVRAERGVRGGPAVIQKVPPTARDQELLAEGQRGRP